MDSQPGDVAEEIKRLQHCLNDLVSVLALPAMWSGNEPSQVVDTLLDVLLGMLQLDFVYVQLNVPGGQSPVETVRFAQSQKRIAQAHKIGLSVRRLLGTDPQRWPAVMRNRIGDADMSLVPLGLGLQSEIGVIVAASERADFPRQTERLILSVAANQASMGLQGARLLSEQKHVASELDRRVAERTTELAATNEELRKEIADRKRAEDALHASQARLSRAIQTATVGEFAAAIAHEINQPLAAVVTNGQACLRWLAAQPPAIQKAMEAAERIVRDGKEAGEVVRRIRALFKQATLERIELDLNEVIGEVLHLLTGETARKRVAVETDLGRDLAPVAGDRVQLQQLIFNLLLNGIEAMDAVVDRPRKLTICSKQPSRETVLVEVRDCGTGLQDPDRIFEAFFTTKENGMGMGLAICRSIIDAHQGRLWAASGEDSGTIFSFSLPVQAAVAS
jgi:C4-dicarboxylate-specific signal transduction histidine kinase